MKVIQEQTQDGIRMKLLGRIDTNSAPEFETQLKRVLAENVNLELDFSDLEYITSAGLRILLAAYKRQKKAEKAFVIRHANPAVMEVFEITGFSEQLDIRQEE